MNDEYLIYSLEHKAYWGPDSNGYVPDAESAGRYSRDEAVEICEQASFGSIKWPNETMLPVTAIPKML